MKARFHFAGAVLAAHAWPAAAATTAAASPAVPGVGGSVVRIMAALAFVIALFLGGVWLFKNWHRVTRTRSQSRLHILEVRSIGPRQALLVVGYDHQRFLVAAAPAGVSLVSGLPDATEKDRDATTAAASATSFALLLQGALGRK